MEKIIEISGQKVKFKATAATPIHYRNMFRRDMLQDMQSLYEENEETKENDEKHFSIGSLESFEKIAYIMARSGAGNPSDFPSSPEEWLDGFDMFSIYEVLPELIKLWGVNQKTLSQRKKKLTPPTDRQQ